MENRHRNNHPSHPEMDRSEPLRLFFYGTLKRGCPNHETYCSGVVSIEPVAVRGRLYELVPGIPTLKVPREDVLSFGTANPLADVATQARCEEWIAEGAWAKPFPPEQVHEGEWRLIQGELMTFVDPGARLPLIDALEDFYPHASSLYHRVLLPVFKEGRVHGAAWVYVAGDEVVDDELKAFPKDVWPCPNHVSKTE